MGTEPKQRQNTSQHNAASIYKKEKTKSENNQFHISTTDLET